MKKNLFMALLAVCLLLAYFVNTYLSVVIDPAFGIGVSYRTSVYQKYDTLFVWEIE